MKEFIMNKLLSQEILEVNFDMLQRYNIMITLRLIILVKSIVSIALELLFFRT